MRNKLLIIVSILLLGIGQSNAQDKNIFSAQLGIGGGDGFGLTTIRSINYSRKVFNRSYIKFGYSQANQTIKMTDEFAREETINMFLESDFIGEENSSEDPVVGYSQFHSFNLGLQYAFRQTDEASLSIYGGLRYYVFDEMYFFSTGSNIEMSLKEGIGHKKALAYEIGLYYNQKLSDVIGLNGSIGYFSGLGFFSGNIGVDIYF